MATATAAPASPLPVSERTAVPTRRLIVYALPWFFVQVVNLPLVNFVPGYYASDLGVPLLQVSFVLLIGRFLDIFTDPLIGTLSDRTRTRFGRRKPWIAAGVPILMAGAWLLFAPPPDAGALYLFGAVTVAYLGFTMIQISFVAWGAELSTDYQGRTRVAGWREGVGIVGTLTAIAAPLITLTLGYEGLGPAMFGIAVGVLILAPLLAAPALLFVPEPPPADLVETRLAFWDGLKLIRKNRAFLIFAAGIAIMFVGVAPGGATGYLMMKHSFDAEALYPYLVFGEWVMTFFCLPFWLWLSGRIGKHIALVIGLLWVTAFTIGVPLMIG
ncbi:MAG: MFS transporter, partial [Pseudomonadota bacterium]